MSQNPIKHETSSTQNKTNGESWEFLSYIIYELTFLQYQHTGFETSQVYLATNHVQLRASFVTGCCNEVGPPLQGILLERCDGNRNIFHACVTMCTPTSNKDGDQGL